MESTTPFYADSAVITSTENGTNDEINQFYFYEVRRDFYHEIHFAYRVRSFTLSLILPSLETIWPRAIQGLAH